MCLCICVSAPMCTCICVFMHMYGEDYADFGELIALGAIQHFVFLDSNVIETWRSRILLDWVVNETQKSSCLCLCSPKSWRAYRMDWGFMWVLRTKLRSSRFQSNHFTDWAFPSSILFVYC